MLADVFVFSGRLGRLGYLGRTLALSIGGGVGMGLLAVVTGFALAGASKHTAVATFAIVLGLAGLALVTASIALMVRRLRDIGLPPWPVCVAIFGFQFLDILVIAPQMAGGHGGGGYHASLPGSLINLLVMGVLLFCPGGIGGDDTSGRLPPRPRDPRSSPIVADPGRRIAGFGQRAAAR